jgi:hypothetical protein
MALVLAIGLLGPQVASAATITVSAGGNLQAAIDAARPGDTILVDPAGTFDGPFTLRAKNGALDIVIRPAAADVTLPAPGQRMDPSYAALLPDIRATTAGPAMKTAAGATNWVLRFLEFLPASPSASAKLVELGAADATQSTLATVPLDLRVDRCYLHGDAINGQRRGVALNSGATQVVNLAMSQQTENIQIRNNLIYDVSTSWATPNHPAKGRLAVIGGGPRNIAFDHNTVDNDGSATIFLYRGFSRTGTAIVGFDLTNNLLRDNLYGLFGDNVGKGTAALNAYTPNAIVLRNTFAGGAASQYPTGNDFPTLPQWQGDFVNYAAHDYHLKPTSPSKRSGTDGTDLGVDFVTLEAAMNPLVPIPMP